MALRALRASALLLAGGLLAGALLASPAAAEPLYPCSDLDYTVYPNGDGSFHYRLATPGVEDAYGNCVTYVREGDTPVPPPPPTPPQVGVCEGPYADSWDGWGRTEYRVGAKVRVGATCAGAVEEGHVCRQGYEPIFGVKPNADGSTTYTVGVRLYQGTTGFCSSRDVKVPVTVPAVDPTVCESAADVSPNGDGSVSYRVGARVSSNGGDTCQGSIPSGTTPAPPPVGVCEGPYADSWDGWGRMEYRVGAKVRVGATCVGAVEEGHVCRQGYEPIFGVKPNADGSTTYTVGVRVYQGTTGFCSSRDVKVPVTVPAVDPTVCDLATDVGMGPGYSVEYRLGARVRTSDGGSCAGTVQQGGTPPLPTVEVCETAYDVEPTSEGYRAHVAFKVSIGGGSCTGVDEEYTIPLY